MSRGMAWPAVGVVRGGEASRHHSRPWEAGARDTTGAALGGWSKKTRVEEALRPLDGLRTVTRARIVHILTKFTKPSVPVNLQGPQDRLPLYWIPASRESIHLFVGNKEALPCVRR